MCLLRMPTWPQRNVLVPSASPPSPCHQVGGPIGLVKDGDVITIDAETLEISVDLTDAELAARKAAFVEPPYKYTRGTMYRYIKTVASAQKGCVTDE